MALCRQAAEAARQAVGHVARLVLPHKSLVVEADRDQMWQVLANLLSNALKYSPAEQPVELTLDLLEDRDMRDLHGASSVPGGLAGKGDLAADAAPLTHPPRQLPRSECAAGGLAMRPKRCHMCSSLIAVR